MLLTPDGQVPGRSMMPIIAQALARAEMQPWRPQGQQVATNIREKLWMEGQNSGHLQD